jgi:hypothetical protein
MSDMEKMIPVIAVSRENYDILNRIAQDYDITMRDAANELIKIGLKHSKYQLYAKVKDSSR